MTWPGRESRGHLLVQSPQLWQSQTAGSAINWFFRPHWASIICLRGNGLPAPESEQTEEQVAHWKHFFRPPPPAATTRWMNSVSG